MLAKAANSPSNFPGPNIPREKREVVQESKSVNIEMPASTDESGVLKRSYAQAIRRRKEAERLAPPSKSLPEPSGIRTRNWASA